jgi:tRNA(Ile)-lysidine synthase TilS/MesJ
LCNEALRQVILDRVGKEHRMTKIATGHNLDEEAVSVLTAMLHGESGRIFAETQGSGRGLIPMITPFIAISEDDIALYANQQGLEPAGSRPCVPDAFGNEVKTMLEVYTQRHPATKYSLLHLGENIRNAGATGMFRDEGSCGDKTDRDSSHQCGTQGKVN